MRQPTAEVLVPWNDRKWRQMITTQEGSPWKDPETPKSSKQTYITKAGLVEILLSNAENQQHTTVRKDTLLFVVPSTSVGAQGRWEVDGTKQPTAGLEAKAWLSQASGASLLWA